MKKEKKELSVILHNDIDYKDWLIELKELFYKHRIKSSCAVNSYLLDFYWKLGHDIETKQYTNTYGSGFYKNLSQDLMHEMPGIKGFSPINLRYMSKFYRLYAPLIGNIPQVAELFTDTTPYLKYPQSLKQTQNIPQAAEYLKILFSIPWDHHRRIIDKCKGDRNKALFFVKKDVGKQLGA